MTLMLLQRRPNPLIGRPPWVSNRSPDERRMRETRHNSWSLTCSCHTWWAGRPASGCSDTSWPRPRPPRRSCRCRQSCPRWRRGSGSRVPRRWGPCGEWWFGRAGRRVGWGEGVRHSCDPDNTQRKTVASSNNVGVQAKRKKGNGKWRRMKMRAKKKKNTGMWNSTAVNNK